MLSPINTAMTSAARMSRMRTSHTAEWSAFPGVFVGTLDLVRPAPAKPPTCDLHTQIYHGATAAVMGRLPGRRPA